MAVAPQLAEGLMGALGAQASDGLFHQRDDWYTTPARSLDRFRDLIDGRTGRPLWTIGEPPWRSTVPALLRGWARYEAVLNHWFQGEEVRSLCLFDAAGLPSEVCAHARATHPMLEPAQPPNARYVEPRPFCDRLAAAAATPAARSQFELWVSAPLKRVRDELSGSVEELGVSPDRVGDAVLAVHELVANAVEHGGGEALVRGWRDGAAAVIDVEDDGPGGVDQFAGDQLPPHDEPRGRGLFLARRLADLVEFPRTEHGFVARLYVLADPAS